MPILNSSPYPARDRPCFLCRTLDYKEVRRPEHRPKWRISQPHDYWECGPKCGRDLFRILLLHNSKYRENLYFKSNSLIPPECNHRNATSVFSTFPWLCHAHIRAVHSKLFVHSQKDPSRQIAKRQDGHVMFLYTAPPKMLDLLIFCNGQPDLESMGLLTWMKIYM